MNAFDFDEDDLQANREDHVTYAQREQLARGIGCIMCGTGRM